MDGRITELEIRFMHQEQTINELNEIVCRQELTLERLERELAVLREQLKNASSSINRLPEEEEPPPHY
jgi:SlyX protein